MKAVPNIFTLLNLFFGCLAIVFALQTDTVVFYLNDDYSSSFNIAEKLSWAAVCLGAAGVVDFLDGFIARLFKATSPLGAQLDSLSDVVSFGVAPGVIIYQMLRYSYAREENGIDASILLMLPAFILTCAAAYRLGKFNLDSTQSYNFKGVPTPAAGLLVASFPLIMHYSSGAIDIRNLIINKWLLYAVIAGLSYLMVSNIPIMGMKFKDYTLKGNIPKVVLALVAILSAIFFHWGAVPIVFIAYIALSLLYKKQLQ